MKTKTYNSLGLEVPFQVPESVEEFDANAKRAGACLDEAINNVIYRGSLAEFRDLFLHGRPAGEGLPAFNGIDAITGIERKTKTVKKGDKEAEEWDETEAEYFKRVCAQLGKEPKAFQDLANAAAALIAFDASARERKAPVPKKLSEEFKTAAKNALAKYDDGKITKNIRKYLPDVADFVRTGDEAKDIETLGWLLKAYNKAKLASGDM